MTLGEKLSKLRKEKNLTQEQLAYMLGVSRQSVSKWESDAAYPETEKLISLANLFECSTDYLLKGDCLVPNEELRQIIPTELPSKHQKIIGYILLIVSLISSVFTILMAKSEEILFVTLILSAAILSCSLICLFVKEYACYWCIWAGFSPIASLSPVTILTSYLFAGRLLTLTFYVVMFFVAGKIFNKEIEINHRKSRLLVLVWILFIAIRFLLYSLSFLGGTDVLVTLFSHTVFALLITYTACYVKYAKKQK